MDYDKTGNYWSNYKGSGEYVITPGGGKAKDNSPASGEFSIRSEPIPHSPHKNRSNREINTRIYCFCIYWFVDSSRNIQAKKKIILVYHTLILFSLNIDSSISFHRSIP